MSFITEYGNVMFARKYTNTTGGGFLSPTRIQTAAATNLVNSIARWPFFLKYRQMPNRRVVHKAIELTMTTTQRQNVQYREPDSVEGLVCVPFSVDDRGLVGGASQKMSRLISRKAS